MQDIIDSAEKLERSLDFYPRFGKTDADHILILDDDNTIGYRWDSTTGELMQKDTATAHLSDYLVLTKARYGLQEDDYDRAMEILEKVYTE